MTCAKLQGHNAHVLSIVKRWNTMYKGMSMQQVIDIEMNDKTVSINQNKGEK